MVLRVFAHMRGWCVSGFNLRVMLNGNSIYGTKGVKLGHLIYNYANLIGGN